MKKFLSLLLALAMVFSLAACTGGNTSESNDPNAGNTDKVDNTPAPGGEVETDDRLAADVYTLDYFEENLRADYENASGEIYDEVLGEFYEYYQAALAELDPSTRIGLMAVAEAKLLESGAMTPYLNNAGVYSMSRIIPRSTATVSWGYDGSAYRSYSNLLITDQFLLPAQRSELVAKWGELRGTGTWRDYAKQWAADNGYTLKDSYTLAYTSGYEPDTWDLLASSRTAVGANLSLTWDGLLRYDSENVQQPGLAKSYEVSADGLTYTFHLRDDIKWVTYQGTEYGNVTADDFVAGLQHAADAGAGLADVVPCIKNLPEYGSGEITDFSEVGVEAVDDYTLVYTLSEPAPWFITVVGYSALAPMSRSYYESQGGKFGEDYDTSADGYVYGTDPQHILYCGAYLVSNYTYQTTIVYTANPSYYDAANQTIKTITFLYNNGEDPLFNWDRVMDGTFTGGLSFNASALEQAQSTPVPDDPDGLNYFEKYAYAVTEDDTSFVNWVNMNRHNYSNFNDSTAVRSPKTVTEADRTRTALLNKNFRLAIAFANDRATVNALGYGEDMKYAALTNSYVPGSFVSTTEDITISINGSNKSFPAGTYYGEILQAQIDADGFPIKVWDPKGNDGAGSSFGFDGWYLPSEAAKYLEAAIEELAAEGVEVSEDNPIYLDYVYSDYSTVGSAQDNAYKQGMESVLGGKVIINLVPAGSSDNSSYAVYYNDYGYEANYDVGGQTGWGPDYGDPQTYLDTVIPFGYMNVNMGLY